MKIISYAWTTPAIMALQKSCTRRNWSPEYAARFKKDELCQAWDRQPRFRGKRIGTVQLIREPYPEPTCQMPDSDWQAEGFEYLESIGSKAGGISPRELWDRWKNSDEVLFVVRFKIIELVGSL